MSVKPENQFPTIAELRDALSALIEKGLGDLPVQILTVPDSTLQAVARSMGDDGKRPAIMIDLVADGAPTDRLPPSLISVDRLQGRGAPAGRH